MLALVALFSAWVALRAARWTRRVSARRRTRRGLDGETVAVEVLRRQGYDIIDTQVAAWSSVTIDGEPVDFEVRADAIVSRRRRRFVAEFKTGASASVANRSTRRQLLEYALCYEADGLLLVDATRRTVVEIEFPRLR